MKRQANKISHPDMEKFFLTQEGLCVVESLCIFCDGIRWAHWAPRMAAAHEHLSTNYARLTAVAGTLKDKDF